MKELLKNKYALLLWGSKSFSRFGDALETLALMYLVYDISGSGLAMGSMLLFSVLPNVIISPFAGVIADKYDKNKIMFFSELARTLAILLIPVLMVTHTISLWHIYAISVIVSIAESFFEPTSATTFFLVVGRENMPFFNSAITISNHIMRILGYTLSGILMATIGKEIIFIVDAITFLASAIISLIVKIPKITFTDSKDNASFKENLIDGFKYVYSNKLILIIFLIIILVQFLATPFETYIPIIVSKILNTSTTFAGYFNTAIVVGAIVGNILYPILRNKTPIKLYHLYGVSIPFIGITTILASYVINPFYYIFMYFIFGVLGSLVNVWSFTEVQLLVSTEYLGRVCSISTMVLLISSPLGGVIFGGLADLLYIPNIFKYTSFIWILTGIIGAFLTNKHYKNAQLSMDNTLKLN